jgi:hypothetical protein
MDRIGAWPGIQAAPHGTRQAILNAGEELASGETSAVEFLKRDERLADEIEGLES